MTLSKLANQPLGDPHLQALPPQCPAHTPRAPPHSVATCPARPRDTAPRPSDRTVGLPALPFSRPATPAHAHIVRPSVQPSEALRVSAADTLDVHLQDQFKPWPQQSKHLFPVPVGLIRSDIRQGMSRVGWGRLKPDRGVTISGGRSGCER